MSQTGKKYKITINKKILSTKLYEFINFIKSEDTKCKIYIQNHKGLWKNYAQTLYIDAQEATEEVQKIVNFFQTNKHTIEEIALDILAVIKLL